MEIAPPSAPPCDNLAYNPHFSLHPPSYSQAVQEPQNFPQTPQPAPQPQQVYYWIRLEVKYPWNAKMLQRTSLEFHKLSSEMNEEISKFFHLGNQTQFNLVYAQKSRWSSKKISLLFAVKSQINFDPAKMKKIMKSKIKKEGNSMSVKIYQNNFKIKTALESEYQHLMSNGANLCRTCGE